jgi:ribose-phosphate pyrophosphokinase
MINILPINTQGFIPYKQITFSGGEKHIELDIPSRKAAYLVDARIHTADEFMELLGVIDAVKPYANWLALSLPYFPGARQDRRESKCAFTAKIYADIINQLKLDAVITCDAHSHVLAALVNNFHNISQADLVADSIPIAWKNYRGIISPDAGAEKKAYELASRHKIPLICGRKHRDPATGQLSGFSCDKLEGGKYLLADDICDGGGTFIGLIDSIRKNQPELQAIFDLWVTHGIFSKGLSELERRFDCIYTTDSWHNKLEKSVSISGYQAFRLVDRKVKEIYNGS